MNPKNQKPGKLEWEDLGLFRLEKRRLGDRAGDLIPGFKYLKECHVDTKELAFCIVLVEQ